MEFVGFIYVLFLLTILPTLDISASSGERASTCNTTNISNSSCKFISPDINSSLSSRNNSINSSESTGNSSNMISNDTTPVYSGQSNTTTNLTDSVRLYDSCFKDSDCTKSSHGTCISLECITKSPKEEVKDCKRCESIDCKDGGCYILPSSVVPTMSPKPQEITTLQLVLLFGSMGGILVVIVIVYCVKTFTDNRRRQYLLKHGVWDGKEKDDKDKGDKGDGDAKSEANRQQRKLEVPTITVETETDSSKKTKKNKENSKDEITDTDGLEEYGKTEKENTNQKESRNVLSDCSSKGCQTY